MNDVRNLWNAHRPLGAGLSIYRTNRSPFWYVRLWNPLQGCKGGYAVRSSKTRSMVEAMRYAYEFRDSFNPLEGVSDAKQVTPTAGTRRIDTPVASSFVPSATKHKTKAVLFSTYIDRFLKTCEPKRDDLHIISRKNTGLKAYFSKHDVREITTGVVRDYYLFLDKGRDKPLANSSKDKQGMVIRKILRLAYEDKIILNIPELPKLKVEDKPRPSFTDKEFDKLIQVTKECIQRGDKVRGVTVTEEHLKMIQFTVSSFVRPVESELFALKLEDIEVKDDPSCLVLTMRGKTGSRTSVTLEDAIPIYENQKEKNTEYLFMDEYKNRTTAINTFRRIFNHILDKAELKVNRYGEERSPYSLRHTGLQKRLRDSSGKVNIYALAKNAGTSVEMLQRFYLNKMELSPDMIRNLQSN